MTRHIWKERHEMFWCDSRGAYLVVDEELGVIFGSHVVLSSSEQACTEMEGTTELLYT